MGGQGVLRADELCGAGIGGVEGEWHGATPYNKE